jgi:hypothetical protein
MKNVKIIKIRDSKLKSIRNNLRLIILAACLERKLTISRQEYSLTHDQENKYIKPDSSARKRLKVLSDEWWGIERHLRASIIKCPGCSKCDRDMIYIPRFQTWYCVQCYNTRFS